MSLDSVKTQSKIKMPDEYLAQELYIYFARDSFCMGDDVCAPNARRYKIRSFDYISETDIYYFLQDYLSPNLPGFHWRGYCGKKHFVDVLCRRKEERKYSFEAILIDGWKEMIMQERSVYFKNRTHNDNSNILPGSLSEEYYVAAELEALLDGDRERFNLLRRKRWQKNSK